MLEERRFALPDATILSSTAVILPAASSSSSSRAGSRKRRNPASAATAALVVAAAAAVAAAAVVAVVTLQRNNRTSASASASADSRRRNSESASSEVTTPLPLLPPYLDQNLASPATATSKDLPFDRQTETSTFWHVPKAGGTTVQDFAFCLGLVVASEIGVMFGHENDEELTTFQPWPDHSVVNVDTTTRPGLQRAHTLGLAESGLADIIFTGFVHETAQQIFNPINRGRLFTLLRHPVERAASMFYYLQMADWEPTYSPETKGWTVQEYVKSNYPDRDWMVRMLVDKHHEELYRKDLDLAKEILREKVVVGLMDRMEESVDRFVRYFDWGEDDGVVGRSSSDGKSLDECKAEMLRPGEGSNRHPHPRVEPGSRDWIALAKLNYWDVQLYEYGVALFEEQGETMFAEEEDLEGATRE